MSLTEKKKNENVSKKSLEGGDGAAGVSSNDGPVDEAPAVVMKKNTAMDDVALLLCMLQENEK